MDKNRMFSLIQEYTYAEIKRGIAEAAGEGEAVVQAYTFVANDRLVKLVNELEKLEQ